MSGIFGIVHKHEAPVTAQSLDTVQAAMAAWGPDGHGRWHSDRVALGHLMLHTTPESLDERQPYRHPADIELVIVADARIDNRDDLFAALGIPCVERQGMPDSALILHAYAAWGERCSEHLLSAFAFAVWDGRQRQLFCARDHVGLKPFYYYDAPQCLVFASDLKGVLACPHVPQRLHEALLAAFLQQDTDFAEKTLSFFDGVCKLPPAHQLRLNRSRCQLESYWFIDDVPDVRLSSDAAYVEQFRALLRQAVDCRLRAAFPVGSHLSGGLDSSLVTILASRMLRHRALPLIAFSWSPPPSAEPLLPRDEREGIALVCEEEAISCEYLEVCLPALVDVQTRDFTTEPTEMMLREHMVQDKAAQRHIRNMLSGWGGDQCASFSGDGYYGELFVQGRWTTLHRELMSWRRSNDEPRGRWLKRYVSNFHQGVVGPLLPDVIWARKSPYQFSTTFPLTFIQPRFAERHREAVTTLRSPSTRDRPGLHRMQRCLFDIGNVTKRVESWARSGAVNRLEYRYPLLDRRILEFCLGIPANQYRRQGLGRYLFRRAMDDIAPP